MTRSALGCRETGALLLLRVMGKPGLARSIEASEGAPLSSTYTMSSENSAMPHTRTRRLPVRSCCIRAFFSVRSFSISAS